MSQEPTIAPLDRVAARARLSPAVKAYVCLAAAHAMSDCFSGVWPMFKKLAGLDLAWAGMVSTLAGVLASASQPIFGIWADHGYRRCLVIIGCFLVCTSAWLGPISAAPGFMHHPVGYATMFAVLLISMFGSSMFHPPAVSLAGNTSVDRRSTFVAVFISCGMVGMASSHLLFAATYKWFDHHTEVLLVPGLIVTMWVVAWCRLPQPRQDRSLDMGGMIRQIIRLPVGLVPLWMLMVMATSVNMGLFFVMPEFVEERGGSDWWVNGGAFGLYVAGSVMMMVPAGHLADRFGPRRVLLVCLVVSAVTFYAMVGLPHLPMPAFLALTFLTGGLLGSTGPIGIALGQQLARGNQSLVTGVMMGFAWAAASPARWVTGVLAKQPSLGPSGAMAWMGMTLGVAIVMCCFIQREPEVELRHANR